MVPVFKWNIERNVTADINYRVIETQFGDGYKQTMGDGINAKDEKYSIRVNARESVAKEIMEFFDERGGHKSFFWTPPLGKMGLYQCRDPKPAPQGGGLYTITGTFVRSYASGGT